MARFPPKPSDWAGDTPSWQKHVDGIARNDSLLGGIVGMPRVTQGAFNRDAGIWGHDLKWDWAEGRVNETSRDVRAGWQRRKALQDTGEIHLLHDKPDFQIFKSMHKWFNGQEFSPGEIQSLHQGFLDGRHADYDHQGHLQNFFHGAQHGLSNDVYRAVHGRNNIYLHHADKYPMGAELHEMRNEIPDNVKVHLWYPGFAGCGVGGDYSLGASPGSGQVRIFEEPEGLSGYSVVRDRHEILRHELSHHEHAQTPGFNQSLHQFRYGANDYYNSLPDGLRTSIMNEVSPYAAKHPSEVVAEMRTKMHRHLRGENVKFSKPVLDEFDRYHGPYPPGTSRNDFEEHTMQKAMDPSLPPEGIAVIPKQPSRKLTYDPHYHHDKLTTSVGNAMRENPEHSNAIDEREKAKLRDQKLPESFVAFGAMFNQPEEKMLAGAIGRTLSKIPQPFSKKDMVEALKPYAHKIDPRSVANDYAERHPIHPHISTGQAPDEVRAQFHPDLHSLVDEAYARPKFDDFYRAVNADHFPGHHQDFPRKRWGQTLQPNEDTGEHTTLANWKRDYGPQNDPLKYDGDREAWRNSRGQRLTVYAAKPIHHGDEIVPGDDVFLSQAKAENEVESSDHPAQVIPIEVSDEDIVNQGVDAGYWSYSPKHLRDEIGDFRSFHQRVNLGRRIAKSRVSGSLSIVPTWTLKGRAPIPLGRAPDKERTHDWHPKALKRYQDYAKSDPRLHSILAEAIKTIKRDPTVGKMWSNHPLRSVRVGDGAHWRLIYATDPHVGDQHAGKIKNVRIIHMGHKDESDGTNSMGVAALAGEPTWIKGGVNDGL